MLGARVPSIAGALPGRKPLRLHASAVQVANETRSERLERAKGYPYVRPSSSFVFVNGIAVTFDDSAWRGVEHMREIAIKEENKKPSCKKLGDLFDSMGVSEVVPTNESEYVKVLAIGSNAGPEQLHRKFPADVFPDGVVIPTVQGVLHDFDVVYAPLLSSYGSCTATLEYSPGASVGIFVTYLTDPLMERMNTTEGAYDLCELSDLDLDLGISLESWRNGGKGTEKLNRIYQYNHQNGTLHMPSTGSPVALKAIAAHHRAFPELDQVEMLSLVKTTLSKEASNGRASPVDLDDWMLEYLENEPIRIELVKKLSNLAQPFKYEKSEVLATLGDEFSKNTK
ncbi:hypothetical protein BSKO_09400 [Bryopsis sp. KO-2023]|nr:hypothetical protein BSKO_09400 [Bryopsis sp. KO-2023]